MLSQIEDNEYIGEIAHSESSLILGGVKTIIGTNIAEVGPYVYCIDNIDLLGQPICQSVKFPQYAKIQQNKIILSSTLGKIIQICGDVIYIDNSGNPKTEDDYNNDTIETEMTNSIRSSIVSSNVRKQSLPHVMKQNSPPYILNKRVSSPNNALHRHNKPQHNNQIYKLLLVRYI